MMDLRISSRNMKLLEDGLNAANRQTTWAAGVAESKAMYYISRSGAAAVKPRSMKALRSVVPNPNRTGRGKKAKGAKFAVKILRQAGSPIFVPTNTKGRDNRLRKIKRLGLAAKAFKLASAVFQAAIRKEKVRTKTKLFDAKQFTAGNKINARLEIFLSYIEKHNPAAINKAISKGMTSLVREFDRDWATALKEGRS